MAAPLDAAGAAAGRDQDELVAALKSEVARLEAAQAASTKASNALESLHRKLHATEDGELYSGS